MTGKVSSLPVDGKRGPLRRLNGRMSSKPEDVVGVPCVSKSHQAVQADSQACWRKSGVVSITTSCPRVKSSGGPQSFVVWIVRGAHAAGAGQRGNPMEVPNQEP